MTVPSTTEWDTLVASHPAGTILQTSAWGRLKAEFEWQWEWISTGEKAGALILYKSLPLNLGTIAYLPRGPLVDWTRPEEIRTTLQAVEAAARRRRAWALWIEPEALDTPELRSRLADLNLKPSLRTIQPPRTIWIDIQPEESEILARMHQKTRYNIRLAERKGVTVRECGPEAVAAYHALMVETGERDGFGIHSEAYYRRALEIFHPLGQATVLLAEVEGQAVAGLIAFALGTNAWYFYGASSERHREKMPPYALQWAAIRWARARGCTRYDLWGIPDAEPEQLEAEFSQRNDGLWGVYRFKRGFGGEIVRYLGLWEKVLNPLYPLALKLRRNLS